MVPKNKFRFANLLMMCGVVPWIIMLGWVIAILHLNVNGQPSRIFMLDPIGMIGLIILVFIYSLLLSGIGLWWSFSLTQKHPELYSKKLTSLRATAGLTIGIPLLLTTLGYIQKIL